MPVFKYAKGYNIAPDSKLGIYISNHNTMDKIVTKNVAATFKNFPSFDNYNQLYEHMVRAENCRKTAMSVLNNKDMLSIDELRKACKYLYEKYPTDFVKDSNAKRCVMCLDYRENYEK